MALRKPFFYAALLLLPAAVIVLGIELLLPLFVTLPCVTWHYWGNRPATLLPGALHRAVNADYDVTFRTNALGFNDREHALENPPGVTRVLLLGDSYVEAIQVPPEKHLARRLEALAERDGRRLEAIVMGSSNQGQSHELANYEVLGRSFEPDVVVLFFCVNDPWNNLFMDPAEGGRPLYVIGPDGELAPTFADRAEVPPPERVLRKHEAKWRGGGLRTLLYLSRRFSQIFLSDERSKMAARMAALYELPHGQGEPVREDEQVMFEKLVARLRESVVDRDGHRLIGVIVSSDVSKLPGSAYLGLKGWAVDTFAREHIAAIDLDARFRERAATEGRLPAFPRDPHWNEVGHAWAAEELHARIGLEKASRR